MENPTDLAPQVPGQTPGADPDALRPLLELPIADLASGLPALTDAEVNELDTLERQGEARAEFLDVIVGEQIRRMEDAPDAATKAPEPAPDAPAPLGDVASYARMAATEIDPRGLERPVLSRDGWVLPAPAAKPE